MFVGLHVVANENRVQRASTISTATLTVRSVHTILGPIVAYTIKCIVISANRHSSQSMNIHRVQLIIADGNIASEKVAQKCDFTYEDTARQAMFQRGRHLDMKMYSLLRDELETCLPNRLFSSCTTPGR